MNGDGKLEIITSNIDPAAFSISVLNNESSSGSLAFSTNVDFETGTLPNVVIANDLDGDGKPEVITGNYTGKNISVFKNTLVIPAPVISSFTPISAKSGATVTVTGTDFLLASSVKFGGVEAASYEIVSATTIRAVVDTGSSGDITVTTPSGTGTLEGFSYISSNATLSSISLSSGTLSPSFSSGTVTYTASVGNATTSIKVTSTVTQANATIEARVNSGTYASVTSGSASDAFSLAVGSNTVNVKVTAQDGTTIKTYTITVTREDVLPVELNTYTAKLQSNGTVLLNWDTFPERNNDHFEISRSSDGKGFTILGLVNGNETSNQRNLYSFIDKNPIAENNYYKLVQVDKDGTRKELGIRIVKVNLTTKLEVSVYPNPTSSVVTVAFDAGEFTHAYLIDLTGKLIQTKAISGATTTLSFNMSDLSKGVYIVKLDGNGKTVSKRIIKN